MILPTTWPFPSQDAATDQRAEVVGMTVPEGKSKGRKYCYRRPPILDDVQDAPY
jgi:hypothetical protein